MTGAVAPIDPEVIDSGTLHVFETMFFRPVEVLRVPGVFPSPAFMVQVDFTGDAEGCCEILVTAPEAIGLAQDFLALESGPDEPRLERVEEVLRELGNMVCGHILSQSESGGLFQILTPVCRPAQPEFALDPSWRRFQLDEGELAVRLVFRSTRSQP